MELAEDPDPQSRWSQTVNARFAKRYARLGAMLLSASALTALGCSLLMDFDESKIPSGDAGGDIALDTGALDTGVAPDTGVDTGTDTGTVDSTTDTGTDT